MSFGLSEGRCLQLESVGLVDIVLGFAALLVREHQVHVLHRLTYGSLQEVVDGRGDEHLTLEAVHVHQCLVGVHHLLQVDGLVAIVGECGVAVKLPVGLGDGCAVGIGLDDSGAEDTAGEVTAVGDEVDICVQTALQLLQTLSDLGDVLVLEGFVDAEVVVAPREVGGGSGLLSCTGGAGDGVHRHVACQQTHLRRRQQR